MTCHRLWLASGLAILLVASVACKAGEPPDFRPLGDGGSSSDGGGVTCTPGRILCSGNQRYECDFDGNPVNQQTCSGAMAACVQDLGCRVCRPGLSRCNPAMPQQVQNCTSDGMGWSNGPVCDLANGQSCNGGACADRCSESALGRSYLGCDYWPTVTANSQLDAQFQYAVALANPQTYPVTVTISGGGLRMPMQRTLRPGTVDTIVLPWVDELIQFMRSWPGCIRDGTPQDTLRCQDSRHSMNRARSVLRPGGAYHVHSNGPIAAYQFNPLNYVRTGNYHSFTNDASLLLPQGVLTQRYIVVTYPNLFAAAGGMSLTSGGFVSIVGVDSSESPTTVTVRLAAQAAISGGMGVAAAPAGSTQTYRVRQGDVLQLVGTGEGDLTGTQITTDKPVAVYVGHDCANVPRDRSACDHLEEQLFPSETWGRDYVVSALRDRRADEPSVVRIVSATDGNVITFDPPGVRPQATLGQGEMLEFMPTQDFRVAGTGAFLVAQFMIGQGPRFRNGVPDLTERVDPAGDPAMVFEVPTEQYRTSYNFVVPQTYDRNFINIVTPQNSQLTMDGVPVRGSSNAVGNFTVFHLPINPGTHQIQSAGNAQFGIKVYGIAVYTSYMYPGGLDLRRITPG